jgi:hypothetical protein
VTVVFVTVVFVTVVFVTVVWVTVVWERVVMSVMRGCPVVGREPEKHEGRRGGEPGGLEAVGLT